MARIRTVKPELFKHEVLFDAERKFKLPLRLAFIALLTCCDRAGRFHWRPRRLKLDIFPYDDIDIACVLDALLQCGFIVKYENNNKVYGCIPSWDRHQQINNREIASEIPEHTGNTTEITAEPGLNDPKDIVACAVPSVPHIVNKVNEVEQVFAHWKTTMQHPNAKLDTKRKVIIGKALKSDYGIEQLCQAITGCSYTPHNMGDNDRGQRYDGLHIILRDGDQIDRFVHNCHNPPKSLSTAERRTQANIHNLQCWMDEKKSEEQNNAST